jgi:hypothetical protein
VRESTLATVLDPRTSHLEFLSEPQQTQFWSVAVDDAARCLADAEASLHAADAAASLPAAFRRLSSSRPPEDAGAVEDRLRRAHDTALVAVGTLIAAATAERRAAAATRSSAGLGAADVGRLLGQRHHGETCAFWKRHAAELGVVSAVAERVLPLQRCVDADVDDAVRLVVRGVVATADAPVDSDLFRQLVVTRCNLQLLPRDMHVTGSVAPAVALV